MKKTINTWEAATEQRSDKYASWSYNGSIALAEYLEELENEIGEAIEFDATAIRCDYTEYKSALDCCNDILPDEYESEEEALSELQANTTVIEFDGGIIVQAF